MINVNIELINMHLVDLYADKTKYITRLYKLKNMHCLHSQQQYMINKSIDYINKLIHNINEKIFKLEKDLTYMKGKLC